MEANTMQTSQVPPYLPTQPQIQAPQHNQAIYMQPQQPYLQLMQHQFTYPSTSQVMLTNSPTDYGLPNMHQPQYTLYQSSQQHNTQAMPPEPPATQTQRSQMMETVSLSGSTDSQEEEIIMENDFQEVRSRRNKRKRHGTPDNKTTKQKTAKNNFVSKNIYDPLTNITEQQNTASTSKSAANKETERIPPFILYGVTKNVQELLTYIKTHVTNFTYKLLYDDKMKVQVTTTDDYRKLRKNFESNNIIFHTFALQDEKTFRVVLRNIHHTTPISEIKEALEKEGHNVVKIMNFHDRITKKPKNLFFIDLKRNSNNKEIYTITKLLNAIVRFEAPNKKTSIVQCKRCQNYGHTRNQCTQPFRCVKCAGHHDYRTCNKNRGDGNPAKCTLCGGAHPANYKQCQVYLEICKRRYPQRNGVALQANNISPAVLQTHQNQENQLNNVTEPTVMSYAQVAGNHPHTVCNPLQPGLQPPDSYNNNLHTIIMGLQRTIEEQQRTINNLTHEIRQLREELSKK